MKKKHKLLLIITISILFMTIFTLSYTGVLFFNKGLGSLDYLFLNIIGDAILVGIITYISSKSISMYISRKEFDRRNKICISVNEIRNNISNYNRFIDAFENSTIFFSLDEKEKKIINYVYDFYIKFLNIIVCKDTEKQLFDIILNIPFIIDAFEDNSVKESFNEILKKFDKQGEFNNISILKVLISKKDIDMLQKFSDIIRHIKHFKVTNLNSSEGCQLLVTADKRVECKIACLPSQSYELYMYYNEEHFIDIIAFSFDFDQKEYASNIYGFKYSNNKDKSKPANINLSNFINIK